MQDSVPQKKTAKKRPPKKPSYKKLLRQMMQPSTKKNPDEPLPAKDLRRNGLGGGTFSKLDKL